MSLVNSTASPVDIESTLTSSDWATIFGLTLIVVCGIFLMHTLLYFILRAIANTTPWDIDNDAVRYFHWPSLPFLLGVGLLVLLGRVGSDYFNQPTIDVLNEILVLVVIGGVGWLLVNCTKIAQAAVYRSSIYVDTSPNEMKTIKTQVTVFRRLVMGVIIAATIATGLLTFEVVRTVGLALLLSAGVVALVLGIAAAPLLRTAYSSLQMAICQPVRIGDIITIDGETGSVEEITATYAVVRTWDERRIIVPLDRFLSTTFQNLTLHGDQNEQVMGQVLLYSDYSLDLAALRTEVARVVHLSKAWDGRKCSLNVSDLLKDSNHIEVQVVVSARNQKDLSALRLTVREEVARWIRENAKKPPAPPAPLQVALIGQPAPLPAVVATHPQLPVAEASVEDVESGGLKGKEREDQKRLTVETEICRSASGFSPMTGY